MKSPAGPAELGPLVDELSVLIENLNAIVTPVGHKQASLGIERERVRDVELARGRSFRSPGHQEVAIFGELYDPRVAISTVSVGDENIAVRGDGHGRWAIERAIAGAGLLPACRAPEGASPSD